MPAEVAPARPSVASGCAGRPSSASAPRRTSAVGHRGLDPARQDRVGADAVARELDGERADHRDHAALGRGVVLAARPGPRSRRGCSSPTSAPPPAALDHVAGGRAEREEHAVEVHAQHALPFLGRHVDERRRRPRSRRRWRSRRRRGRARRGSRRTRRRPRARRRRRRRAPATRVPWASRVAFAAAFFVGVGAPDADVGAGLLRAPPPCRGRCRCCRR